MPTPMPWPAALNYTGEDPWRKQPDQDGPTDSLLGLSQGSLLARGERCITLRIVLQVDAIILTKNDAHIEVDMNRKDRCALVLIHRAFHNDE
ncbi:hypothetical protein TNCV_661341 [Trichonephila clavipes]|nr:hypothetical protein TNCV_661341 [Trichonephila clavipes]